VNYKRVVHVPQAKGGRGVVERKEKKGGGPTTCGLISSPTTHAGCLRKRPTLPKEKNMEKIVTVG